MRKFFLILLILFSLTFISAWNFQTGGVTVDNSITTINVSNYTINGSDANYQILSSINNITDFVDLNATGLVRNWNNTGWIINWNASGYIRDWSGGTYDDAWINNTFFTKTQILNFGYYNSTNFDINNYYLKSNPYSYYNSTNPSPVTNTSYYPIWNPYSYYNVTTIGNLPNTNNYWNNTYATFNKTYADTLYNPILSQLGNTTIEIFSVVDNQTFRKLPNVTFVGNGSFTTDVCVSGGNCLSSISGGNSSFNQSYTNLLYAVLGSGNTSLQMFQAVDNGTFLKISQWNSTNTSYYLITNPYGFWNDTYATFNKTYADTLYAPTGSGNSSWNQSYASGELYFTKAQWNATNTSYALNQTLTDMWSPFLNTTNTTYYSYNTSGWIRDWSYLSGGATNTTYRTDYNLTWVGNLNSTGTIYSDGINNLTIPFLFNSTGLIKDWNSTGYIQNWSLIPVTETDPMWTANITNYFTKSDILGFGYYNSTNFNINNYRLLTNYTFLGNMNISDSNLSVTQNVTASWFKGNINASDILNAPWISTFTELDPKAYNGTLAYNQTLTDMWSAFLDKTNTSYLLIDKFNVTNTTYRTLTNGTYINLWNVTGNILINETKVMTTNLWNATNTTYRMGINNTFTTNVNISVSNISFSDSGTAPLNISMNGTCVMIWGSTSRMEIC